MNYLRPTLYSIAKAGLSSESETGLLVSVFDACPAPSACRSIDFHTRFDFSKRRFKNRSAGSAAFAHANNLANHRAWLADLIGTIPFDTGRKIFFGMETWRKAE